MVSGGHQTSPDLENFLVKLLLAAGESLAGILIKMLNFTKVYSILSTTQKFCHPGSLLTRLWRVNYARMHTKQFVKYFGQEERASIGAKYFRKYFG